MVDQEKIQQEEEKNSYRSILILDKMIQANVIPIRQKLTRKTTTATTIAQPSLFCFIPLYTLEAIKDEPTMVSTSAKTIRTGKICSNIFKLYLTLNAEICNKQYPYNAPNNKETYDKS